ncbi:MAG TPA: VCBS repeat-containing protein, partial [Polyangium sp.]|nr:VCBS repeat-containing protein [Polyangium sp.]
CGPIANDKDPDDECWGGACNGAGVCKQYNGVPCTDKTQCLSNFCVDGFCCGNICTGWCYACSEARKGGGYDGVCGPILSGRDPDNECSPGECNGTGTCNQTQTPLANGAACVASAQCASGNCVDGVCCDTACTGSCQACSATKKGQGTNGTCGNIKYDTDPDEECHGGACSGIGMCQYYNSAPCTAATQCLSAYCVDGVCCGNQCTGTCYACTTAKKGSGSDGVCGVISNNTDPDNECGFTCNGAGACSRAPNGSTCTIAAECTSGFCVDGVCCNNSCQGSCMMCNTPAAMGTCTAACPPPCSGTIGLPAPPVGPPLMNESVYIGSPADLNNDGLIDLIYRPAYGSGVSVKLNQGGGTFGPASTYAANYSLLHAAVGDVNGDGFADLVMPPSTTSTSSGTLIVLLNQTNGTFGAPITLASATGVISAVVFDLNGDGTNDIATVCPNTISVFLNQGGGTFAPRVDYANANSFSPLRAGDFNGDGRADLVFRMNSGGGFSIMYNQGNGTFAAPTSYPIGVGPEAMVLGDVNADGKLDLALTNPFSGLSVVINQGNGGFAPRVEYAAGASPDSISMADFNADGKIDIAVLNDVAVGVFLNLGNGTFGPRKEWSTNGQPNNFQVGDVDGDGDIDFVCGNLSEARIVSNLGNAVFGPTYTEYPLSGVVELGDLNGDGKLDLVVGKNDRVLVRFNQGNGLMGAATSYTVGTIRDVIAPDLNGDGKADVVAATVDAIKVLMNNGNGLLAFTGSYATTGSYNSVIAADFTGDGKPDIAIASHNTGDSGPGPLEPRLSSNVLRVYANQGNGALVLLSEFGGGGVYDLGSSCTVAAADLNGDGKVDMAFSSPDGNMTRILLNQGNATFVEGTAPTQSSSNMLAADLNGDGKVDLLMSGVLLNQGNATFVEQGPLSVPWTALLADMNGDSRPDLIGRQIFEHTLSLALNQGNGTFPSYATYPSGGTQPEFLVAGDIDNDDIPEIVVGNTASDTVTILKRNCFP